MAVSRGGYEVHDNFALDAMREALISLLRADLKARVMAVVEPDIDRAIDDAIATLNIRIESMREYQNWVDRFKIKIDRAL